MSGGLLDFAIHLRDHLTLCCAALAVALAAGLPLGAWLPRAGAARGAILGAISTARVVPSLAVLAFMLPILGVGFAPALAALALLAIPPIVINTDIGMRTVGAAVRDAARGLGMSEAQIRRRIDWPLALPIVIAGVRTATVEVIASATLAAFIGGGRARRVHRERPRRERSDRTARGRARRRGARARGRMGFGPGASLGDPHAESGGMNRRTALGLIASASLVAGCGNKPHERLIVGSKNFTEELLLGELYAQLLEHYDFRITRKLNLGGTQVAMAALRRGDIDLYPEYTGTALITELKLKPTGDAAATYKTVRDAYARDYQLVWLDPAPMNNTQALATTQAVAAEIRHHHAERTEPGGAEAAARRNPGVHDSRRRLARPAESLRRLQLQATSSCSISRCKYRALQAGSVDVVVAFGTDGQIARR